MKDEKRIEILLKVIERVYGKNPGIQTLLEESVIDVCKEEVRHRNRYFFAFLCCWLYRYGLSKHNFFMCEEQLIFSGGQ